MTYVSAQAGQGNDVLYTDDQGVQWIHSGGSRAWRNNNPGNIRGGAFARQHGAIGNAGGFAVFPDHDTGQRAIVALMRTDAYSGRTINDAITRYAPPNENNTANYQTLLGRYTGLDTNRRVSTLDDGEMTSMAGGIQRVEGWIPGTVTRAGQGNPAPGSDKPAALPVDLGDGHAVTATSLRKYWAHTELERGGGYFPIGANSTWHGGVHLRVQRGKHVVACAPGEVVAARLYPDASQAIRYFGSVNFILLKHKIKGSDLNRIANMRLDDGHAPAAQQQQPAQQQAGQQQQPAQQQAAQGPLQVQNAGLRLRDGAGTGGTNSLGTLRQGDVLERSSDPPVQRDGHTWYRVTVRRSGAGGLEGQSGWVASEYVRNAPAQQQARPAQQAHPAQQQARPAQQQARKPFDDNRELFYYSLYMHLEPQALTRDNANLRPVTWLAGAARLTMQKAMNLRSSPGVRNDNVLGQLAVGDTLVKGSGQPQQVAQQTWIPVRVEHAANASLNGHEGFLAVMQGAYREEGTPDQDLLTKLAAGGVVKIERRTVKAGDLLWFSSVHGPETSRQDLVHWQIFSEDLLFPEWHKADDGDDDFNLNAREITSLVDQTYFGGDDVLSAQEVAEFYAKSDQAKRLRTFACKFQDEWALDLDVAIPKLLGHWDTDGLKDHWQPHLFWRDAAAAGVPLPASPKVWHYNPVKVAQALAGGAKLIRRDDKVVPHFSQADEAWGGHTLGSHQTIRAAGCAMTSTAMVLKYYGREVDPGTLDAWLDDNHGYSGDALLFDKAITFNEQRYEPKLKYERKNLTTEAEYRPIIEQRVQQDLPTIVEVHYANRAGTSGDHFVVIVGLTEDGKFIMNDPGTRNGDGASDASADNVIQTTTRHTGYQIRSLRLIDPR